MPGPTPKPAPSSNAPSGVLNLATVRTVHPVAWTTGPAVCTLQAKDGATLELDVTYGVVAAAAPGRAVLLIPLTNVIFMSAAK